MAGRGSASSDDAWALEHAARELESIASTCEREHARMAELEARVAPMSERTRAVIGQSATGQDRTMSGHLDQTTARLRTSAGELKQAAQLAGRLAQEARQKAEQARAQQAESQRGRR